MFRTEPAKTGPTTTAVFEDTCGNQIQLAETRKHGLWGARSKKLRGFTRVTPAKKSQTIEEYIETFPENVQNILEKLRDTVQRAAPKAVESISYDMPTFKLNGKRLVYFSAWKNHIGFYSIPEGNEALRKELAPYTGVKSSLRFQLDKPIPYDLVKKIVMFRMKEIQQK